jgi:hypothetical protein
MPEIILFCEDWFHGQFVGALLRRFAANYGVGVKARFLSSEGGLPGMQSEFRIFLRDLARQKQGIPHSIIVVVDANCKGYTERRSLIESVLDQYQQFQGLVSYAIPDPHIERWMLVDPGAFQKVFGRGCTLPATKCAKREYKRLL